MLCAVAATTTNRFLWTGVNKWMDLRKRYEVQMNLLSTVCCLRKIFFYSLKFNVLKILFIRYRRNSTSLVDYHSNGWPRIFFIAFNPVYIPFLRSRSTAVLNTSFPIELFFLLEFTVFVYLQINIMQLQLYQRRRDVCGEMTSATFKIVK